MSALTQLQYRAPKAVGIIQGTPSYESLENIPQLTEDVRVSLYSPDGTYFAFTQPTYVTIINPDNGEVLNKIELKDVYDLHFSPSGSFLSTWEKPLKLDSGNFHNNVKIYNAKTCELVGEYSYKDQSGWKPDFTLDEKIIARLFKNEVKFYQVNETVNFNKHWSSLKLEHVSNFKLSPGQSPKIATFIPEKNGKPANVSVFNISTNITQPVSTKTFFKAEKCSLRWNSLGTALLALASTDFDSSNKSYYGETTLYLLSIAGAYDSRITLDKEGPIHDITWSPSAREFGVVYGYMPAKTTFFDARGNSISSLPPGPKNTVLFSPHARYILVAGFGNLQGTVDIYDRLQKFQKVSSFEAPNTSVCEWSPDGRYILTATTSPRLRVDNSIKIWYATGKLIFNRDFKEVYSAKWRPRKLELFPPIKALDENPEPHQSGIDYVLSHPKSVSSGAETKPKGAYRPPHARTGNASSAPPQTLYEREINSSRTSINSFNSVTSTNSGLGSTFRSQPRQRVIPGVTPPPADKESKTAAKNRRKRENKQNHNESGNGNGNESNNDSSGSPAPAHAPAPAHVHVPVPQEQLIAGGVQSLEEKKIRSLLKKLRAIEQLKMKQANNEPLEDTQVLKIQTEETIRSELHSLGWRGD
jgi:translation initiation factor 2A